VKGVARWRLQLETSKENFSKTASISDGEFTVEVSFSKWSSSFLGGDRCHNEAKFVEVKIVAGGKVYAQRKLSFKDGFEMYSPFLYRLRQDLCIDALKETGSSVILASFRRQDNPSNEKQSRRNRSRSNRTLFKVATN
jgi:hypothetical protein